MSARDLQLLRHCNLRQPGADRCARRGHRRREDSLIDCRARTRAVYFEYCWNVFAADKDRSIPAADRKAYVEAYSKPGRMHAAWACFASWPQLAKQFARLSQTKLTMPALAIGGDKSLGNR